MNEKTIISIDAETNKLWGQPFAVAFVIIDEQGEELERALFRCPIADPVNSWVKENVLPEMAAIQETHGSLEEMLAAIGEWWVSRKDATAMWHMGHIVEAGLFRLLVEGGHIGEWDAPYVPIEVSQLLKDCGYAGDSVDGYAKQHDLKIEDVEGGTHNPLYDCLVTNAVYMHLLQNK